MSLKEIVGKNLKYFRYKSGKSQEKYYTEHHLNYKYLAAVERGEENVSSDYIETIAKALNLKTEDLITFDESHIISKKRVDEKVKE